MKRNILYISALLAIVLTGCQKKEMQDSGLAVDGIVKYTVALGTPENAAPEVKSAMSLSDEEGSLILPMICTVTTKGSQVNTSGSDAALSSFKSDVSSFTVKAYSGTTEKLSQTVTWSDSSNSWEATPVAYWPQATELSFLAYTNLPASQTATVTSAGVTTTHTVPAAASAQKDILFGHYEGKGSGTGTADITFEHPLTAVRFLQGEMGGSFKIEAISLIGVAASGTAKMDAGGNISWSGITSYNHTVSQSKTGGLDLSDVSGQNEKLVGEPFLIIPQKLSEHVVTVKIKLSDGREVFSAISSSEWAAGKTNTYIINVSSVGLDITGTTLSASITNVGFVKEFLRVAIVANWCLPDDSGTLCPVSECPSIPGAGDIVYTNFNNGSDDSVGGGHWEKRDDGYFYYTKAVDPGVSVPLFDAYAISSTASYLESSTLVLTLIGQAVEAGTTATDWSEAAVVSGTI